MTTTFRVEQFYIPSSRHWLPGGSTDQGDSVIEDFDSEFRLRRWRWGGREVSVRRDVEGRIVEKVEQG